MNILVIYGGKSCEHDISIITGSLAKGYFDGNVISAYVTNTNECYLAPNNLAPFGHKTVNFDTQILFELGNSSIALVKVGKNKIYKRIKIDVAVNCCHGVNGEDGAVSALCNYCNIPLVGSAIVPSAIGMDKVQTKRVLTCMGLPVLPSIVLHKDEYDSNVEIVMPFDYPVIVKPAQLGSSIGISVCKDVSYLRQAIKDAFLYDDTLLVEKALTDFVEVNCSAMKVQQKVVASQVYCPTTANEILTFNDKYISNDSNYDKSVSDEMQSQVRQLTTTIYTQLCFSGVIRVDYLLDSNGKLYVNEINTIPGSLAYPLWQNEYSTLEFGKLLVDQAIADYQRSANLQRTYRSQVLNSGHGKKMYL